MNPKQSIFRHVEEEQAVIKINEYIFLRTEQFSYLGVTMTDHNMKDNEIQPQNKD